MRASARCALGQGGWREDFDQAIELSRVDATTYVSIVMFKYVLGIPAGALLSGEGADRDTAEAMQIAGRCSEDFALHMAQLTRGIVLMSAPKADRQGLELLDKARGAALGERFTLTSVPIIDTHIVADMVRGGDVDAAIELGRRIVADQSETGTVLD